MLNRPGSLPGAGITLPAWLRMLSRPGASVDWRVYWQRAAFLTAMACLQSVLGLVEWLLWGRRIQRQTIHMEPVFILGHPRTGGWRLCVASERAAASNAGMASERAVRCSRHGQCWFIGSWHWRMFLGC